jgi:hypothetical protein
VANAHRAAKLAIALTATAQALRKSLAATRRAESFRARTDTRAWVVERRERTHHLIELGGLVQKSGLVDLLDDDRAALYGALLSLRDAVAGETRQGVLALWRRRGQRAFAADQELETAMSAPPRRTSSDPTR